MSGVTQDQLNNQLNKASLNCDHIDDVVNGVADTYTSPDGNVHKSITKMEADFDFNAGTVVAQATAQAAAAATSETNAASSATSASGSAATATTQAGNAATSATAAAGSATTVNSSFLTNLQKPAFGRIDIYTGTEDIQPIVAGKSGGIVVGFSRSTGRVVLNLNPSDPVLLALTAAATASVSSSFFQNVQKLAFGKLSLYTGSDDIQPIVAGKGGGVVLGFSVSTGYMILKLNPNDPNTNFALFPSVAKPAARLKVYSGSDDVQPVAADRSGRILLGVNVKTQRLVAGVPFETASFGTVARVPLAAADKVVLTDWNGAISYGQSNSNGCDAVPPISTSQPYSNLTFGPNGSRATKTGNAFGGVNQGMTATAPLIETQSTSGAPAGDGWTNAGESLISGMANWCVERAFIENDVLPSSLIIFASCCGHQGSTISQLSSVGSTQWYQNLVDHVTQAKALATAAGKSYACHAVAWVQGESDGATSRAAYGAALIALRTQIETSIQAITGQATPVHMLTWIKATGNTDGARLGTFDAAVASPRIHAILPEYILAMSPVYSDHRTPQAQLLMGRYFGRALKQIVIDQVVSDNMWPIAAYAKGTQIYCSFRAPTLPIMFDTSNLPSIFQNGFVVNDDSGAVTLSSMTVVGGNTVMATLSRSLSTNPVIRYAMDNYNSINTNLGGNLRDATSDTCVISGTTYPMFHAAMPFQLPVIAVDPTS